MAKDNSIQNQGEHQMARPCPKDCTKCGFHQHAFCSAQMSFYLVEKVNALQMQIEELSKNIMTINEQMNAVRSEQERGLINPIQDIAQ